MRELRDAIDEIVSFSLGQRRQARPRRAGPPLGLGVIGAGRWGELLARRFAALADVRVAALTARRGERRVELAAAFPSASIHGDPASLLGSPDVDAVVIATPPATHHELAIQALERGKHVLVEKPFTLELPHADELVSRAAAAARVLMVDHTWLFEEAARRLKALVASGEHGRIGRYAGRLTRPLGEGGGGALAALGVHHIALLDYLAAESPLQVTAEASGRHGIDRAARARVRYPSGLQADIEVDGGPDAQPFGEVVLDFDDGTRAVWTQSPAQRFTVAGPRRTFDSELYRDADALTEMAGHFAECVMAGRSPISNGASGRRTVAVLEACERAWAGAQARAF